ncbi:hypothetical protein ACJ72_05233 [Emergomyces africanus]|uniref:Ubiquitin 3 binding protein But2 C-terminal domain-containing protein n=1 Tax=Emergomyces africanus TaxID=1955775 RepID=A0A1B7NUW8_9EURO|nr:hypothetical protein ACJ72_05233 [Emergomyces africanus]
MFIPLDMTAWLALFSLLGVAVAAAVPDGCPAPKPKHQSKEGSHLLSPRCKVIYPTTFVTMSSAHPDNGHRGSHVDIKRVKKGDKFTNTWETLLTFTGIPDGATGCMLRLQMPETVEQGGLNGTGPAVVVDVWKVGAFAPKTDSMPTFNHYPNLQAMVATFNVPVGGNQPFDNILASDACSSTMSFLLRYSDWQQGEGSARWVQLNDHFGFSLIHSC